MTIAHLRPYRLLRIAVGIAKGLVRYLPLLARQRLGRGSSAAEWDRAHAAAAAELRDLALALSGALTKAAQIGGARADILPAIFIETLSQFHDAVPPRSFESLREIVESDLGARVDELFEHFDREAIAAASLAQVHAARLRDGREVVVKIQYPEASRIIPLDLGMLRFTARLIRLLQPNLDLRSLVFEVTRFIELELDFEREIDSMERLAKILSTYPDVLVPSVHRRYCGKHTIVMERLDGIQVSQVAELRAAGHKPSEIARKIGALYGTMIFETGFFHGDPHPGNLLVLPDGRVGLLDYGLCKELPEGFARDMSQLIVCALIGDTPAALEAAEKLGFDVEAIRSDHLRSLFLLIVGDSNDDALVDIVGASRIRKIPEDFALVVRTLVLLNGLSHRLAPNRRLVQAELLKHLAAGAAQGSQQGTSPSG